MATELFDEAAHKIFYVIDLSSYLLRAYHAVAPLSSPSGEPTHAVHGMVTMVERFLKGRKPKYVGVAMDSGRQTFRKELYPEYKANRPPAPDDLRVQIRRAEEFIIKAGFATFKQEGVEADDLIATSALKAKAEGFKVVIVSSDKDLMQLVDEDIVMWDTLKNKVFGQEEVLEKFKVRPDQLGDLLALMGDSSDNIPGVPSVGPKTAATLLNDYETLDGIYEHLEDIKRNKLKEALSTNEDLARLSRKLVELKKDCALDVSDSHLAFPNLAAQEPDALRDLFRELGFHRQLASFDAGTSPLGSPPPTTNDTSASAGLVSGVQETKASLPLLQPQVTITEQVAPLEMPKLKPPTLVTTTEAIEELVALAQGERVAIEVYTTRPDAHRGPVIAASIQIDEQNFYIPFGHRYVGAPAQIKAFELFETLFAKVNDADWATHNVKRLAVLLWGLSPALKLPPFYDTMLGAYLLNPEQNQSIEALAAQVELEIPDYDAFSKEKRKKRDWDELEVEKTAELAQLRVISTYRLVQNQNALLGAYGFARLLREVESPLSLLLAQMEIDGVLIDTAQLERIGKICGARLAILEKKAHSLAGKEFNVNSPKQLEQILFDELGLKPLKRTKTARSTDAQTLEALKDEHELPMVVLEIRQVAKLKGTYVDALPLLADKAQRVHGSWEQAVTATGRISSVDPNLQNIPIRSELGREIRSCFIARPGCQLVAADYSQIELRVLAHLSQDERLLQAFRENQDIHLRTAMEIFDVPEAEVDREMRSRAKAVNFGVIYGQGESGLSKALGIPRKTAKDFIERYFERYQGVTTFMEKTLEAAREGHAVESILGRRRKVPDIQSGHRARRLAAERIAMNMPIQGSAADILKLAMLKLKEPVVPGATMMLTVHDELVFEIPDEHVEVAKDLIRDAMQGAYPLDVPLLVSVDSGPNWNSAH